MGATAESGKAIISLLRTLCSRDSPAFQRIAFLTVSSEGLVTVLHSLFSLPAGEFEEGAGDLCALAGELPPEGKPSFVRLSALTAAANEGFIGCSREDFDAHVTSLSSTSRGALDEVGHESVSLTEPGARYLASRGLCFVPPDLALCVLELGPEEATISKVASLLFPLLLRHGSPHFDGALDWLQASLTARDDDNLVGGVIRTRRDLLPAPAP